MNRLITTIVPRKVPTAVHYYAVRALSELTAKSTEGQAVDGHSSTTMKKKAKRPRVSKKQAMISGVEGVAVSRAPSELEKEETRMKEVQRLTDEALETMRRLDPDGEILGMVDRVKDPLSRPLLSEMETGEETSSRPINRFRQIVYDEGELDNSDLSKPPSPENPHPFDPNSSAFPLPPTHSRSLTPYANHLPIVQRLLDLGVNLLEVERTTRIGRALVRLDWERDARPKVHWLIKNVGVRIEEVGSYLTRNPFFLLQDMAEMKKRVGYLLSKGFPRSKLPKVMTGFRYWLNMDIPLIDSRLGWIQRQFHLRGDEVRQLIIKEPRVIQFGLGPIQRLVLLLNKDKGFSPLQLKVMLLADPRLFMMDPVPVFVSYNYLAYVMGLDNAQITKCPEVLRCPVSALRRRHEYLHRLNKAQYCEDMPDYVPLTAVIHPSDRYFAEKVAGTHLADYDRFTKLM